MHGENLVLLPVDDSIREALHRWTGDVGRRPTGHHDRLRMVVDHSRHEAHIRFGVWMAETVGSCLGDGCAFALRVDDWCGYDRARSLRSRGGASRRGDHDEGRGTAAFEQWVHCRSMSCELRLPSLVRAQAGLGMATTI